ncbi:hypothetical protein RF11_14882 [Thelohanellus kitauei]|uniref:Uncharacterized protein n=1 Tax=Thelohanellus kitauei TaxID=669202 RepID=A0A0C2I682_THEKT|nr:hypothetical protein RF11_14882 [Thelohanellus kitauei]
MRLTPNISEFFTNIGIHGPVSHTIFAAAYSLYRSVSFWPTVFKLALKNCSLSWSDTISSSIEDTNAFGNPDKGLESISQVIASSSNPQNLLLQEILFIPLF